MRERVKRALKLQEHLQGKDESSMFQPLLMSEVQAAVTQQYPLSEDFLIADGYRHSLYMFY